MACFSLQQQLARVCRCSCSNSGATHTAICLSSVEFPQVLYSVGQISPVARECSVHCLDRRTAEVHTRAEPIHYLLWDGPSVYPATSVAASSLLSHMNPASVA